MSYFIYIVFDMQRDEIWYVHAQCNYAYIFKSISNDQSNSIPLTLSVFFSCDLKTSKLTSRWFGLNARCIISFLFRFIRFALSFISTLYIVDYLAQINWLIIIKPRFQLLLMKLIEYHHWLICVFVIFHWKRTYV